MYPLPIPPSHTPERVGAVWRVPYEVLARAATHWTQQYRIQPAATDAFKICLVAVDVQNTFCVPEFELFVGGRSGIGAVDDTRRLCEFIYRHLNVITQIVPTMDTHQVAQIFHALYLIDERGEHPAPFTLVSIDDVMRGVWKFNPALAASLGISREYGQRHLEHYTRQLKASGKYELTIWPYHAMLGGIGHALVSAFEQAVFFHSLVRHNQPDFHVKGDAPLTEHYSVLSPEVKTDCAGKPLAPKSDSIFRKLREFDAVIIAGEAKSHCVAWTIADLLDDILIHDHTLAEKVYLLEDCTSPVVIPGVIDYTAQADAAFQRFADAGMRIVRSTTPMNEWSGMRL
ncbi:MAG: isochorismatase [Chloroflexi bacterium]|nr:isochorismatase [Chloroflexota bacterium]